MKNKKLLVVHLNEFNHKFLIYGAKKYNLKYLAKLLRLKSLATFTKDITQNKNLDPWVQSVSINTGKSSKKHKIFKLGQKIDNKINFIWDLLSKKNIDCFIWGSINSKFNENKYLKVFFPDPWNYSSKIKPAKLKHLHLLPKYYAKNYTQPNYFKIIKYSILFLNSFIKNYGINFLIKYFYLILSSTIKQGLRNFILFFLFDLISLYLFKKSIKTNNQCFSYIFLNSLAHFQHNNWSDKKIEKYYFIFVEQFAKEIFEIYKKHSSLLILNGFSQIKVNKEYLIRPKNPYLFLRKIIKFKSLEQDMTNGGFIFFKNRLEADNAHKKLKNFKICGLKIFEILQKKEKSFYYRVIIKTNKNLNKANILKLKKNTLEDCFKYENTIKKIKMNLNREELLNFLNSVELIKSTGVHSQNGILFVDKIPNLNKKSILENHAIFNICKNYFLKK